MSKFIAFDRLREQLEAADWTIYLDRSDAEYNECNWIACKTDGSIWPHCECNGKSPQFTVKPVQMNVHGERYQVATVRLGGEMSGLWYKADAQVHKVNELMVSLPSICRRLAAAWSAMAA